jgi:hypothetical protein
MYFKRAGKNMAILYFYRRFHPIHNLGHIYTRDTDTGFDNYNP